MELSDLIFGVAVAAAGVFLSSGDHELGFSVVGILRRAARAPSLNGMAVKIARVSYIQILLQSVFSLPIRLGQCQTDIEFYFVCGLLPLR